MQRTHDRLSSKWRELRWRWNSLRTKTARSWFHQESRPSSCRFLPVPRRPPSNFSAMTSMMLTTAFRVPLSRSLLLSPSRICNCRHVSGPDASLPTSIAPLPCVDVVVVRVVDRWQVTSGHCRLDIHSQDHSLSHTCTCTGSLSVMQIQARTTETGIDQVLHGTHEQLRTSSRLRSTWTVTIRRHRRIPSIHVFARRNSARLPQLGSRIGCSVVGLAPFSLVVLDRVLLARGKVGLHHCRTHSL